MHEGDNNEKHTLVTGSQVIQKFLGFNPCLLQVIGHSRREVVLVVLTLLPPGNISFYTQDLTLNVLHSFIGGNGDHVNANHQAAGETGKRRDHFIIHIAGIGLEKQHPAKLIAHLKVVCLKGNTVRTDIVLKVHSLPDRSSSIEGEVPFLTGPEEVVENTEPVMAADGTGTGIQPSKGF